MKTTLATIALAVLLHSSLRADDDQPAKPVVPQGDTWTRTLKEDSARDTLLDALEKVRGDSGKWNDDPKLQHAPPLSRKPAKMSLDDWYDRLERTRRRPPTPHDDNWLLFKSRQLDDNDRQWVERIERRGNQFTVTLHQAIWQGRYQKSFTYYNVLGVKLGQLAPGTYQVTWIIKPLEFKQFAGDGRPRDAQRRENWPRNEMPADKKAVALKTEFRVAERPAAP